MPYYHVFKNRTLWMACFDSEAKAQRYIADECADFDRREGKKNIWKIEVVREAVAR